MGGSFFPNRPKPLGIIDPDIDSIGVAWGSVQGKGGFQPGSMAVGDTLAYSRIWISTSCVVSLFDSLKQHSKHGVPSKKIYSLFFPRAAFIFISPFGRGQLDLRVLSSSLFARKFHLVSCSMAAYGFLFGGFPCLIVWAFRPETFPCSVLGIQQASMVMRNRRSTACKPTGRTEDPAKQ